MKKIKILINIAIIFAFIALMWSFIIACKNLDFYIEQIKHFTDLGWIHEEGVYHAYVVPTIEYSILVFLNSFAIPICAFLFVYCNPKLFRRSTWVNLSDEWAKNKEERAAARAAKADADKQKRIEELKAELDALNGDKN